MNKMILKSAPATVTTIDGLTIVGRFSTEHAASSYGQPVFVDNDGQIYDTSKIVNITTPGEVGSDEQPTQAAMVYDRVRSSLTLSQATPHITALAADGLIDTLSVEQAAAIVRLMQAAYHNGRAAQGAEKVDDDYVWLDGVGGLERQTDGTWHLINPSSAAAAMGRKGGASTSGAKAAAARKNGKKGGRPRKSD